MNRRILYNRASADPEGKPWSEHKSTSGGTRERKVGGRRRRRLRGDRRRLAVRTKRPEGWTRCQEMGLVAERGWKGLAVRPCGLEDGPLPVHYEPVESPVPNLLYDNVQYNPAVRTFDRPDNPIQALHPRVSLRRDHLPPDRASHQRGDEPLDPLALRAAAELFRDKPRAGREGREQHRLGDHLDEPG